jgi:hypothetical protein
MVSRLGKPHDELWHPLLLQKTCRGGMMYGTGSVYFFGIGAAALLARAASLAT